MFNNRLSELTNDQFISWTNFCDEPDSLDYTDALPLIKSLYLIARDGLERLFL